MEKKIMANIFGKVLNLGLKAENHLQNENHTEDWALLKGVKEVLKRSNSSHREETCYVEALFYF